MGRLVKFALQPGNAAEGVGLPALVVGVATQELIADKAYDTDRDRNWLTGAGICPAIPTWARRRPAWYDPGRYGMRRFCIILLGRGFNNRGYKM